MEVLRFQKANCKDCYKCIRECPVKSIRIKDHQAQIIADECLLCGRCVVVCPQNAKEPRNDVQKVRDAIAAGRRVVASVAPSFIAGFECSGIAQFEELLQKLGFAEAHETALGAYIAKTEYERMVASGEHDVIISSCCHSVTRLIEKYYPDALKYLAHTLSPMLAHGRYLKQQDPDCYTVFIGPCISKIDEAERYPGMIDCVLTFDEVADWLREEHIELPKDDKLDGSTFRSRFFPRAGGILASMDQSPDYKYIAVDGVEQCIEALQEITTGKVHRCFIEMSACVGSCINGPSIQKNRMGRLRAEGRVDNYAACAAAPGRDFDAAVTFPIGRDYAPDELRRDYPGEAQIREILARTGKTLPEHELNCGCCGYPTCREKAIAVYQGKADIEMCLPYMKERAESFSNQIINSTPNAILALDTELNIQQINRAAEGLFQLDSVKRYIGRPVSELMDPWDFNVAMEAGSVHEKKTWLSGVSKYVELSIVHDEAHGLLVAIMRDVTAQEEENEHLRELRRQTVDITDKVIGKQMRIVQEIASLLGETTAETKIALNKLKNVVAAEEERHGDA